MDEFQASRRRVFENWINRDSQGVEIGPSYRPTFPKAEGWKVLVIDHCDTAALVAKYRADPNIPPFMIDHVETVDLVWSGAAYSDIPEMPHERDFVVACHVIEHTMDLIGFFNGMSSIVRSDGLLMLAIPSAHLTFDFYRPLSTLGDVIMAHRAPAEYDVKARLDEVYFTSALNGLICWDDDTLQRAGQECERPIPSSSESEAVLLMRRVAEGDVQGESYRDGHRWVFEQDTFIDIVCRLQQAGLIDFGIEHVGPGAGCEFLVVLRRGVGVDTHSLSTRDGYLAWAVPDHRPASRDRARLDAERARLDAERALQDRVRAMEDSTSWRLTRPLRGIKDAIRRRSG